MMKRGLSPWISLLLLGILAAPLSATTWNSPTVDDGIPPSTGADILDATWQSDELLFEDPVGDSAWGPFNDLQGLWVTWNADGIYFSVSGALWDQASGGGSNSVNLYIDIDYGQGTGLSDLNLIANPTDSAVIRNFKRTLVIGKGFGCDWGYTTWAGRYDLGFLDISDPDAPVNLFQGVSNAATVNTHTSAEGVIESRNLANNRGYELFVPWAVFYPDAAATVPAGSRIALAVAIVGGADSLSPEAIGEDASDRVISDPVVFVVDGNGDGIPDEDWPPSGSISGTVTLDDPLDTTSVVDVVARVGGNEVGRGSTPAGGGAYSLTRLAPATYEVLIQSAQYIALPQTITLGENEDLTGIDFDAIRVLSNVGFTVAYQGGPEPTDPSLSTVATLSGTTDLGQALELEIVRGPGESLDFLFSPVPSGAYTLSIEPRWPVADHPTRTGYYSVETAVTVPNNSDPVELGTLDVEVVVPTRVAFHRPAPDGDGARVGADSTTVSLPEEDFYAYLPIEVGFVDEDGVPALHDLPGLTLLPTTMDPAFPTQGEVLFWSYDDTTLVEQPLGDASVWLATPGTAPTGRARFLLTDDAQEVVRLEARATAALYGVLEIAVLPVEPAEIAMTADASSMLAGDRIPLRGRLLDVSGNPVLREDFTITFEIEPSTPGSGPSQAFTNSQGAFGAEGDVEFTATVSGTYRITATGTLDSGVGIRSLPVTIEVAPQAPDHLALLPQLALQAGAARLFYDVTLVDEYGNASPRANTTVTVNAGPAELVSLAPSSVLLDDDTATNRFEVELRASQYGIVETTVSLATLPVLSTTARSEVLFGLAAVDERAPESDEDHNADPGIDLTSMFVYTERDTLVVELPFSSNFTGAHMVLLLEWTGTAEGATQDFFGFPVYFAHEDKPDLVFTYKYAANDYADMRRASPSGAATGQWYNIDTGGWVDAYEAGVDAKAKGLVEKSADKVVFRLPIVETLFGASYVANLDTLRAQVYVPQEDGEKRPALDSVPHDATVDMIPPEGNWWEHLPPRVDLSHWAATEPRELPGALSLTGIAFDPAEVTQGETTVLTARPVLDDPEVQDPIFQVFADLSRFGGDSFVQMRDDGLTGDETAGDGIYSLSLTVDLAQQEGDVPVLVTATELTTGNRASVTATLAVTGEPELQPLLTVEDAQGDDHGPNQPGRQFLYYTYPTNVVFFPGVFDLEQMEVFDAGSNLLFRVKVGEITDPSQPDAADWAAPYPSDATCSAGSRVDLNLQNVVILIDSDQTGGSTKLPENRWVDVARQDAWEYALVADGWWMGMIRSNKSSSSGNWDVLKEESNFSFCVSSVLNTIDFFVSKSVLGVDELTPAELEAKVLDWDFIVAMAGHDGDSNDFNWGAVRWVNEGRPEWQFGGGKNGEFNRERDSNVIDVMTHVGGRRRPGRTQEEQLDFTTPEAERRFADPQILVACELEAEGFEDRTPPSIVFLNDPNRGVRQWRILTDAPVSPIVQVSDPSEVKWAKMLWRGVGEPRSSAREVPMGLLRSDLDNDGVTHIADVPWEEFSSDEVTNLVDLRQDDGSFIRVRYMIISFEAEDEAGNRTAPGSVEYVIEVPETPAGETELSYTAEEMAALATGEPADFDLPEGSRVRIPRPVVDAFLAAHDSTGTLVVQYGARGRTSLDLTPRGGDNPSVLQPSNRFLNTARFFRLWWEDDVGEREAIESLPGALELSIHFPWYDIEGEDPANLQLFHYEPAPIERWVLVGGHAETSGSTLTTNVIKTGLYGVFNKKSKLEGETLVTGLQLSPNPFSPNGDGIHDELTITYVVPDPVDNLVVEIFDMRGERVRTLRLFDPEGEFTNRTLGILWDGKDEDGRYVPMGIYICRVEVNGKFLDRWERATAAVAVVR